MPNYAGVSTTCLVGKETTFGTPVAATLPLGYMTSVRTSERNNIERVFGLGSRYAQASIAKIYEASGSVEGTYTTSRLLAYVCGSVATTGASAPYTHTIVGANTLPFFSLEVSPKGPTTSDDVKVVFTSTMFTNFELTAGLDQPVRFTSDWLASQPIYTEAGTGTAAAFDTNNVPPLAPQTVNMKIDASNAVGQVQNLTYRVENDVDYVRGLGSRFPQAPVPRQQRYEVRGTVNFNSSAAVTDTIREIVARFLGDASTPFQPSATTVATVDNGNISITNGGSGAALNLLTITMDDFIIDSIDVTHPVDGIVTLDFTAFYETIDSAAKIVGQDALAVADYGADI